MQVRGMAVHQTQKVSTWTLSWLFTHQAVWTVFGPLVKEKGCFYHLTQATFRKIQALELVSMYRKKEDMKQFCGMIDSLAFVPVEDLAKVMDFLKDTCTPEPERMKFERTNIMLADW